MVLARDLDIENVNRESALIYEHAAAFFGASMQGVEYHLLRASALYLLSSASPLPP